MKDRELLETALGAARTQNEILKRLHDENTTDEGVPFVTVELICLCESIEIILMWILDNKDATPLNMFDGVDTPVNLDDVNEALDLIHSFD